MHYPVFAGMFWSLIKADKVPPADKRKRPTYLLMSSDSIHGGYKMESLDMVQFVLPAATK